VASVLYTSFFRDLLKGDIDMDTATVKAMLTTNSYTENKDHDRRDDVTNEITATGYTAGGVTITPVVSTVDTTNDRVTLTLPAATWSGFTGTARRLIYYVSTGTASADPLIACVDFGSDVTRTAQTFEVGASTVTWQN
jgi:hypothetical protein